MVWFIMCVTCAFGIHFHFEFYQEGTLYSAAIILQLPGIPGTSTLPNNHPAFENCNHTNFNNDKPYCFVHLQAWISEDLDRN